MPTLDIPIAASADDASEAGTTVVTLNGTTNNHRSGSLCGYRFIVPDIALGDTIDVAHIIFVSNSGQAYDFDVHAEEIDDAPQFTTTNADISGRSLSAAAVNVAGTPSGAAADVQTGSLAALVQAWVDRAGHTPGDAIAFVTDNLIGANSTFRTWDNTTGGNPNGFWAAELHLEYTTGGGGTDALDADPITTGAPTLGTPTIGQVHALTSNGDVTGSPTLGTPTIGQTHVLASDGDATGAPTLGTPTLGQTHALAPLGVTSGVPDVGLPVLGQVHGLATNGDATGAPTLGTPSLGQVHALSAGGITTGAPTLGTPTLAEVAPGTDALDAVSIVTGQPTLGVPALGQVHALDAVNVVSGQPTLGTPALGVISVLDAVNVVSGQPSVGSPTIGQVHVLIALGILTGPPTLGTPDQLDRIAPVGRRSIIGAEGRSSGAGGTGRITRPKVDHRTDDG